MRKKTLYIAVTSIILLTLMMILTRPIKATEKTNNTSGNQTDTNSSNIISEDTKIRILPIINSNILGDAKKGDKIKVITTTNNWAFVQENDITGWITLIALNNNSNQNNSENTNTENTQSTNTQAENNTTTTTNVQATNNTVNTVNNESTSTDIKPTTKYISSSSAYIRSKASADSSILATLIKNTDVKVTGEENGWYKVTYESITGYIRKDLITDKKIDTTSNTVQ